MSAPVHATRLEDAVRRGKAWRLSINALDPTGANDIFAYINNTSQRTREIHSMEISSTVAGNVEPQRVTGTAAGGTNATTALANLSGKGEKPAEADVQTAVDITGLTNVFDLGHYYLIADTPREIYLGIRVPAGQAVAFNWEAATGILSGSITFFEVSPEDED